MNESDEPIDPESLDFKYYIFDWDNNILHMPTRIHLERRNPDGSWGLTAVSTSVFALVRNDTDNYRPPEGDWELAFKEFRDLQDLTDTQFLLDTREALQPIIDGDEEPAPSFHVFKKALIEGRLIGIVTARGHYAATLRKGVEYFIEHVLTSVEKRQMQRYLRAYLELFEQDHAHMSDRQVLTNYLSLNRYHAITSPEFIDRFGNVTRDVSQEAAKQLAIREFVLHIIAILRQPKVPIDKPISFGFSDDDPHNVKAVEQYIANELAREFPSVKFVVYDTSDPDLPQGRKIIVQGQLELGL